MRDMRNAKEFVFKHEGRPKSEWVYNIKMDLNESGHGGAD
jgi:hypothetical protein